MDTLRQTTVIVLEDTSQVSVARRAVHELAGQADLGEERRDKAEIAVVELANNLVRYAQRGRILLNAFNAEHALEIISVDSGPGMADTDSCLRDGYTTGTTLGLGLGAIQRLSQSMDIYSALGKGTVISAVFYAEGSEPAHLPGVVCVPYPGETVCGDRWACIRADDKQLYMMVDGLGHGHFAAQAAELAVDIFMHAQSGSPPEIIERMHQAMRSTRGAAAAVVSFDPVRMTALYCGVGNISGSLHGPSGTRHLVSHNGIVGHQMRPPRAFEYPWQKNDLLILHSDGISTHWQLKDYPGLNTASPSMIAGAIYRDFTRGRDDATVLGARLD